MNKVTTFPIGAGEHRVTVRYPNFGLSIFWLLYFTFFALVVLSATY